jgi:hypothetical protein
MTTVFDRATRAELIRRINTVDETSTARWGRMNVYQMLKHCTQWDAWIQGTPPRTYRQTFIGRLFGRMALRNMTKDDKPLPRNIPTTREFRINEATGDVAAERQKWAALVEGYEHYSNPGFIHDFFGRMTREQVGQLAYKHTDHHLRQFGA